jgi:zinc/manganese transport system permease protein
MTSPYDVMIAPFVDFVFMRRGLIGCCLLTLGASPLGVLLILRRMSLMGEAMAHAVLPGIALGFLVAGLSVPAMGIGGMLAGLVVAALVGLATRHSQLKEDANLAAFYLIALALGVMLVSLHGTSVDLVHLLFGTVLAVDDVSLRFIASTTSLTLFVFGLFYRPIMTEAFDPIFMGTLRQHGTIYHLMFLMLVVINLVASFQALGTLMAVGLMMLPAAAARFWAHEFIGIAAVAVGIGMAASAIGLLISFQINVPSGAAIILTAGVIYIVSMLGGPLGSVRARYFTTRHLTT